MKLDPDKTWISLSVAIAGVVTIVGGAVWINSAFKDVTYALREQASATKRLEVTLDRIANEYVTRAQLAALLELLRARNPSMTIPDLR